MLEFSKWLNENIGEDPIRPNPRPTNPRPTPGPMRPTKTPVVTKPDDSDSAGSGIDLETKPLDKNRLQSSVNDFLKKLDEKITRMIGKTLNAYKNKNSDAFNRAAITLKAYHNELMKRYKDWTTKLISRMDKAPSPPPMNFNEADQRYSLGQYAQEMYKVAKKTWEEWLESGLVSGDADAILWLANKSGYKDIALKAPQYKKVDRLPDGSPDGSLDLSQFIKVIEKSGFLGEYRSNKKLKEQVDKINELPIEEYKELLNKVINKLDDPKTEELAQNAYDRQVGKIKASGKLPELLRNNRNYKAWTTAALVGGIVTAASGMGTILISAIILAKGIGIAAGAATVVLGAGAAASGAALQSNKDYKTQQQRTRLIGKEEEAREMAKDSEDELKKHVAEEFLKKMVEYINAIGRDIARNYMGSIK